MTIDKYFRRLTLHTSSANHFSPSLRKKIKDAGGDYNECRGYSTTRYINIPTSAHQVVALIFSSLEIRTVVAKSPTSLALASFSKVGQHIANLPTPACVYKHGSLTALEQNLAQIFDPRAQQAAKVLHSWDEEKKKEEARKREAERLGKIRDAAEELLQVAKDDAARDPHEWNCDCRRCVAIAKAEAPSQVSATIC